MRQTRVAVFVHLVWATWDRLPLVSDAISGSVYRTIGASCARCGAEIVALGGTEDHVHLLVRLPATLTVAELVKAVKGSSAHLVTHDLKPGDFFKWQGSYGAFSVSPDHVATVNDYIARQAEHHAGGTVVVEWEPVTIESNGRAGG